MIHPIGGNATNFGAIHFGPISAITPSDNEDIIPSTPGATLTLNSRIHRTAFNSNIIITFRNDNSGHGTAIHFKRCNRGRLLLGFTHLAGL